MAFIIKNSNRCPKSQT